MNREEIKRLIYQDDFMNGVLITHFILFYVGIFIFGLFIEKFLVVYIVSISIVIVIVGIYMLDWIDKSIVKKKDWFLQMIDQTQFDKALYIRHNKLLVIKENKLTLITEDNKETIYKNDIKSIKVKSRFYYKNKRQNLIFKVIHLHTSYGKYKWITKLDSMYEKAFHSLMETLQ